MKTIAILGCGWVGSALKKSMENEPNKHYVVNCLTRDMVHNKKQNLYECDTLLIAIPPRENYIETLKLTLQEVKNDTQVILLSSTSFYKEKPLVVEAEKLLKEHLILRLGGLMGYNRIAGKYTAGKTKAHDAPVNYVHQDDVVAIIKQCIEKNIKKELFDVVAPKHPLQSEIYARNAKDFGWEATYFESKEVLGRVISPTKLIETLHYTFLKEDPIAFWS
ncbi:MAG: Unknown protein [uncultured Sulfurovum sp.]|uniref:Pyrroline-5-carboxylate reductase catalytic N-terminal domain-containing protein n=1 Tax=uncultured Sulfurovum sp. TaxID=269237 RepID=A0A6S6UDL1_9BACT|nr:MAG: Unknown protein [uncultured Sulfurovum sp.]